MKLSRNTVAIDWGYIFPVSKEKNNVHYIVGFKKNFSLSEVSAV